MAAHQLAKGARILLRDRPGDEVAVVGPLIATVRSQLLVFSVPKSDTTR